MQGSLGCRALSGVDLAVGLWRLPPASPQTKCGPFASTGVARFLSTIWGHSDSAPLSPTSRGYRLPLGRVRCSQSTFEMAPSKVTAGRRRVSPHHDGCLAVPRHLRRRVLQGCIFPARPFHGLRHRSLGGSCWPLRESLPTRRACFMRTVRLHLRGGSPPQTPRSPRTLAGYYGVPRHSLARTYAAGRRRNIRTRWAAESLQT
jgi:hypothetical protein